MKMCRERQGGMIGESSSLWWVVATEVTESCSGLFAWLEYTAPAARRPVELRVGVTS
ncbi:MAG: hypothetical protein ACRCWR_02910 [Saezia sp.]